MPSLSRYDHVKPEIDCFSALSVFYEELPKRPYCGHLKDAVLIRTKALAIQYPYIQVNPPGILGWLIIDVDKEGVEKLDNAIFDGWNNMPAPNFIVRSPDTRTAHCYYQLHTPVNIGPNGRVAPKKYLKKIKLYLVDKLGADPDYVPRIAKNPFATEWDTQLIHSLPWEFSDFSEFMDFPEPGDCVTPLIPIFNTEKFENLAPGEGDIRGRNCDLFRRLCCWAYRHVNGFRNSPDKAGWRGFRDAVYEIAHELNSYNISQGGRLDVKEVNRIAASVSSWTWINFTGEGRAVGVMAAQLADDLTTQEKQALGAEYTHQQRKTASIERLARAIQTLQKARQTLTKKAAAAQAGMSRKTAATHWEDALQLAAAWRQAKEAAAVHYGVYQVAAALAVPLLEEDQVVIATVAKGEVLPFPVKLRQRCRPSEIV